MKKNIKLVLALVLSIMMVLGSMSALAAEPAKGSITITNSNDEKAIASDRRFKAYRILNATETFTGNDTDGYTVSGIAYTIPNDFIKGELATWLNLTKETNETDAAFEQRIITEMGKKSSATETEAMAKKLLEIAKKDGSELTAIDITGGTAATNLDFGYYVIEDVTNPAVDNVSAVMLDTNTPNVTIKVKATVPELDKKIDEGTKAVDGDNPAITSGNGKYDDVDLVYDNHRIGDDVPYVLRSFVPEMTGYTKYYYIVNDTMSKGLTFNNDVVIKIGEATLTKNTDYTVTTTNNADGSTGIEIIFKNFIQYRGTLVTEEMTEGDSPAYTAAQIGTYVGSKEGQEITITYSAKVNGDAVIGVEGNPNTAKLIFSNNPNETVDHEPENPDKPKDITVIGNTPDSKVITYVTGLKLKKVDPTTDHNPLAGATFELSGNLNKVEVLKAEKYVKDDAGDYWGLTEGGKTTYTQVDPATLDKSADNYDETIAKYIKKEGTDEFQKYSKTTVEEKTASGTPKKVTETTDANGTLIFDGMGDGKFTLTETQAPTGYNLLKTPIEFEVEWVAPTAPSTNCTWKVKDNSVTEGYSVSYNAAAGEFEITVENQTGTELPSTGGIGTTIFYVAGSILVLAAAILLITKRRMSTND